MTQEIIGVLGATGFVGRNLIRALVARDIKHVGTGSATEACNTTSVTRWIKDNQITQLINLAAKCGGIGLNQTNPADLWQINTQISTAVLSAARITGINKYIAVGTVCSFAKHCHFAKNH